ncbi:MAG: ABC transporter substrate-binding protein [Deltaproteobacteria bacterium]|nr:ABC transporter substrate-binding protein [Deltaproteobacteria bacterium]
MGIGNRRLVEGRESREGFGGHPCRRLGVAVMATLLLWGSAASAAPKQDPTEAIRGANDRLRELLAQKTDDQASRDRINAQITRELRQLLDIGFLAERALADHWEKMTPKQRSELQSTLQAIVEKNYLSQLRGNLEYKVDYVGEVTQSDAVLVKTLIRAQRRGRPARISVNYRLRAEGDHWRIFDVITEDVSILQNYRAQFNRIIAKDGVDGLIARMKAKLEKGERLGKMEKTEKAPEPKTEKSAD